MFELSQLRCFVAVAEEQHFRHAAIRLNMTQAPLSRQIQILERILNVQLLERTSRSVRLTPAGRSFLPEAQRLIRGAEVAMDLARNVASGRSGALKIGFTAACAYDFLSSLISASREAMPDVAFSFTEMISRQQVEALVSSHIDLGFMRPPISPAELETLLVESEPFMVAIPEGHRLVGEDSISIKDLDGEPFLMYSADRSRYFHDQLTALFASSNVLPRYVQHISRIQPMLALVKAGLGTAIVPESAAAVRFDGIYLRPLKARKRVNAELFAVWRRNDANPLMTSMVRLLRSRSPANIAAEE